MHDAPDANSAPTRDIPFDCPAPVVGALVPQQHGGALRLGSTKGNTPGSGTPAHVRLRALHRFAKHLKFVDDCFAEGSEATVADKLRALDLAGRYGLGPAQGIQLDDVRDRLSKTLLILQRTLPPEFADAIMAQIEEVWQ